jgi:erythromycin esterase
LRALLVDGFKSVNATGQSYNRAQFITDSSTPGPTTVAHCTFAVLQSHPTPGGERVQISWILRGTFTSSGTTTHFTAISRDDDFWIVSDSTPKLYRQRTLSFKQWFDGRPQPTEIYVAPLSRAERSAVVADLRKTVNPLRSAYPGGSDADLAPILRAVGDSRVIAMGEGTHGTSEFFALKDRVFRYLVERDGVRVFAQETNWSDGENIERYLQTGQGNLRNLLGATFSTWDNQETLDLLQWMRAYNIAHPHALHFFGIDMQKPDAAATLVIDFYKQFDATDEKRIAGYEGCIDLPLITVVTQLPGKGAACIESTRLAFEAIAGNAGLESVAGRNAYSTAYHAADVAHEATVMWGQQAFIDQATARDRAMARNVEWLTTRLYPESKVFLWAHNVHISVGADAWLWPPMGTYLRAALGPAYFAIGQTFDHGGISAAPFPPVTIPPATGNQSEVILREVGISPFFLNFHDVSPHSPLGGWLSNPHGFRLIGYISKQSDADLSERDAVYLPRAYDAMTFITESHPAHSFKARVAKSISMPQQSVGFIKSVPWTLHSAVAGGATGGAAVLANGQTALFVTAKPEESGLYSTLGATLDAAPYRGKTMELRGMLAASDVTQKASLSVEVIQNDTAEPLVYQPGSLEAVTKTNFWSPFSITFAVPQRAQTIQIGLVLYGPGNAWLTDLSLGEAIYAPGSYRFR